MEFWLDFPEGTQEAPRRHPPEVFPPSPGDARHPILYKTWTFFQKKHFWSTPEWHPKSLKNHLKNISKVKNVFRCLWFFAWSWSAKNFLWFAISSGTSFSPRLKSQLPSYQTSKQANNQTTKQTKNEPTNEATRTICGTIWVHCWEKTTMEGARKATFWCSRTKKGVLDTTMGHLLVQTPKRHKKITLRGP